MEYKQITFSVDSEAQDNIQPILHTYGDNGAEKRVLKARLDKWLWAARFFKTRALARAAIENGQVIYDGQNTTPGKEISIGATVVISQAKNKRAIVVKRLSTRRHNNDEASELFEDLA